METIEEEKYEEVGEIIQINQENLKQIIVPV